MVRYSLNGVDTEAAGAQNLLQLRSHLQESLGPKHWFSLRKSQQYCKELNDSNKDFGPRGAGPAPPQRSG